MAKSAARLSGTFKPEKYTLRLDIDPGKLTFAGTVVIDGHKRGRPSSRLSLHSSGLTISAATITRHDKHGSNPVTIDRINTHKKFDELRLHTVETLYGGRYTLTIDFSGTITEAAHGLYPCFYDEDGIAKTLIATQLESHHAREVFPCIDEPAAKAVIELEVRSPAGQTVISNMPVHGQSVKDDRLHTRFLPTPAMSTYLLALIIGDVGFRETRHGDVIIRAYATPGKTVHTDFALDTAKRCLKFYDDYFGTPYPLPKLDMIALPDMPSVVLGMENWGLITYRESAMLVDEKQSSMATRQLAAQVINHEIAHQWFGNLVTMEWWDDLWLNESFAHVMEFIATDELFPEWKIWQLFREYELEMALTRDALPGINAIKAEISHPELIGNNFDRAIAYAKGGAVLNMMRLHIGEKAFRAALKEYFSNHKYGNTVASDLWAAMDRSSGRDITGFMAAWIEKPGYPLVDIDWVPGSSSLSVTQSRFVIAAKPHSGTTLWRIPLSPSKPLQAVILEKASGSLSVGAGTKNVYLNEGVESYFLSRYVNEQHRTLMCSSVAERTIGADDRMHFLQSQDLLDQARKISTVELLELLQGMDGETETTVWVMITTILARLRLWTEPGSNTAGYDSFVNSLLATIVKTVGWDAPAEENPQLPKLRQHILRASVAAKNPKSIAEAQEYFTDGDKFSTVSADVRSLVYAAAALSGQKKLFTRLLHKYKDAGLSTEQREEVAIGITSAQKPEFVETCISMLNTPDIRQQDLMMLWLAPLFKNPHSRRQVWQWLKSNWDYVTGIYGGDMAYERFPQFAAATFRTEAELMEYKAFFEPLKKHMSLRKSIELGEDIISSRIAWRAKNENEINTWLGGHAV